MSHGAAAFAFHAFLLCLTTAAFPVRQEVSSVSCHSPLSCGHFLMFCQRRSVLLTQNTELLLLVVGSGRTEQTFFFMTSGFQRQSNVKLLPVFTTFFMITFLSATKSYHCLSTIFCFLSNTVLLSFLCLKKQNNSTFKMGQCRHIFRQHQIGPSSSHGRRGFCNLLRNVDCDGCLAGNPAFTVS